MSVNRIWRQQFIGTSLVKDCAAKKLLEPYTPTLLEVDAARI